MNRQEIYAVLDEVNAKLDSLNIPPDGGIVAAKAFWQNTTDLDPEAMIETAKDGTRKAVGSILQGAPLMEALMGLASRELLTGYMIGLAQAKKEAQYEN